MCTTRTVTTQSVCITTGAILGAFATMGITRALHDCDCAYFTNHASQYNCTTDYHPADPTRFCYVTCGNSTSNYDNLMHAYDQNCYEKWKNDNGTVILVGAFLGACVGSLVGRVVEVYDLASKVSALCCCFGLFATKSSEQKVLSLREANQELQELNPSSAAGYQQQM